METVPPAQSAVDHLRRVLAEASGRTRVDVVLSAFPTPPSVPGEERRFTDDELAALARANLHEAEHAAFANGSVAVVHVLYVDGGSRDHKGATGLANGHTAFLFGSQRHLPAFGEDRAYIERAVLVHEVGHLLGLVNRGVPMVRPHEDPASPHHSANPESVMTSAVDAGEALLARLDEGRAPPSTFDADDLADLRAYRARLAGR